MNPVSDTAYYCTGVRMLEARKPNPACNDTYAARFMDDRGLKILDQFKKFTFSNTNNAVRHRIIDDLVEDAVQKNSKLPIFLIGAGFDSRAYRMTGGNWIEIDEPQIINIKNEKLPISECNNPLQRLAIDFSKEALLDKLTPYTTESPSLIIIEGVFMYLNEECIENLLTTLKKLFPSHHIFCDLMTEKFFHRHGKRLHHKLRDMNAEFRYTRNHPESLFIDQDYTFVKKSPITKRSIELKAIPSVPTLLLNTVLRTLRDGYSVYEFEYRAPLAHLSQQQ